MPINLVAIVKDESRYIGEWLAYHLSLGVDRIFVFDNESTDGTTEILRRAAVVFPVEVCTWPTVEGRSPQISAYNHYLDRHREPGTLTGFIDIDEFLVSRTNTGPLDRLRELAADPSVAAVCINQRVFGDSGQQTYRPEPLFKRFTRCTQVDDLENHWVKSFYKLDAVDSLSVHSSPLKWGRHVHPNGCPVTFDGEPPYSFSCLLDVSHMQLSHFITKTLEEFRVKQQRGGAAGTTKATRLSRYTDDYYFGRQRRANDSGCEHAARIAARVDAIIADFEHRLGLPPRDRETEGRAWRL